MRVSRPRKRRLQVLALPIGRCKSAARATNASWLFTQDIGLVVLPGGLVAQDVRGAPEPGFEFLLRQHPPEMIPEGRERKAKDLGRGLGSL
jgi:hypothetical protein